MHRTLTANQACYVKSISRNRLYQLVRQMAKKATGKSQYDMEMMWGQKLPKQ